MSLYDGTTLNLQGARAVNLLGKVWMGRLQYAGAYLAPSWSMVKHLGILNTHYNISHLF
nr:vacuolating cyotoxin family protein [Helicobacter acinonychis]